MQDLHSQIQRIFNEKVVAGMPARKISNILLIDNDKHGGLLNALTREGYHVVHCDSVQEAWNFIYPHPPELIIVHLTVLNRAGLADLDECWALAEGVPIALALSARVKETLLDAVQHRVAGILTIPSKPKKAEKRNEPRLSTSGI